MVINKGCMFLVTEAYMKNKEQKMTKPKLGRKESIYLEQEITTQIVGEILQLQTAICNFKKLTTRTSQNPETNLIFLNTSIIYFS